MQSILLKCTFTKMHKNLFSHLQSNVSRFAVNSNSLWIPSTSMMVLGITLLLAIVIIQFTNGVVVTKNSGETCTLSTIADTCEFESHATVNGYSNTYPLDSNLNLMWTVAFGDSCRQVTFTAEVLTLPEQSPGTGTCLANSFLQIGTNQ